MNIEKGLRLWDGILLDEFEANEVEAPFFSQFDCVRSDQVSILSRYKLVMSTRSELLRTERHIGKIFEPTEIQNKEVGQHRYFLFDMGKARMKDLLGYKTSFWLILRRRFSLSEIDSIHLSSVFRAVELEEQVRLLLDFCDACARLYQDDLAVLQVFYRNPNYRVKNRSFDD